MHTCGHAWMEQMHCQPMLPSRSPRSRCPADAFQDDQTFFLCMLALEELGATGNKARARPRAREPPPCALDHATDAPLNAATTAHPCLFCNRGCIVITLYNDIVTSLLLIFIHIFMGCHSPLFIAE